MGIPPERRFRFEKPALVLKDPRVNGSERGGPGLPRAGDRETAGKQARPSHRRVRGLPRTSPVLWSGAAAGPKSSLKEGHSGETSRGSRAVAAGGRLAAALGEARLK